MSFFLCGKAIQAAGKKKRNTARNVAEMQNFGGRDRSPRVAVVFAKCGSKGLLGSGNTANIGKGSTQTERRKTRRGIIGSHYGCVR